MDGSDRDRIFLIHAVTITAVVDRPIFSAISPMGGNLSHRPPHENN